MTKLTRKQEIFAIEFVKNGGNASEAYRKAYNTGDMKPRTIWRNSYELLKNNKVATMVADLRSEISRELHISAAQTLKEIACIAFFDIRRLFDQEGNLKKITDLDDDTAAAIAGVDIVTVGTGDETAYIKKIKLWDKNSALEKLAKHFSFYADRVEHSVDDSLTRLLRELDGKTRLWLSSGLLKNAVIVFFPKYTLTLYKSL